MPKLNKILLFILVIKVGLALELKIPENLNHKVAISVLDLTTNQPVYDYNSSTPMLLASNMKVITSYVAINTLSWDFRFTTRLAYTGTIRDGILNGNLYLIGGGDPSLTGTDIKNMLHQLPSSGIRQIAGKMILDASIFNQQVTSSELAPEPYAPYSVDPNGLLIDNNLTAIHLQINRNKIRLIKPGNLSIRLKNNLKYTKTNLGCDDVNNYITIYKSGNNTLSLNGQIPKRCNHKTVNINYLDNFTYNQMIINSVLKEQKIAFKGMESGTAPDTIKLLAIHDSESINTLLPHMNKTSDNTYAKTLLLSLGAYKSNNDYTYAKGKTIYLDTLARKFSFPELALENGSGLSRHECLSSKHMVELLTTIYKSSYYPKFKDSLPTPAESSTLEHIFTQYSHRLYVKTGTLNDVSAYSGYYLSQNQHTYALSIIANNINTNNNGQVNEYQELISKLLTALDKTNN